MQSESLDTSVEAAEFMRSFEEYNESDDDTIIFYENTHSSEIENPVTELLNNVLQDRAKYNKSYASASAQSKTMNLMPGAQLQLPTEKNKMKRGANLKYRYQIYVFCEKCKMLVKKNKKCENCLTFTKKKKNNYFIYINIRQQIMNMFDKHLELILSHVNKERDEYKLADSFDGNVYKKIKSKLNDEVLLPFSVNVDGAKIFNSSKSTLWPIQLIQHYLPENVRYKNIFTVGLYCGAQKPDVSVIMEPFATEMANLMKNGICTWHENRLLRFLPCLMFCVCDLPARAEMQNCKQSGYYGCMCCLQKGEAVKNAKTKRTFVRFLKSQEPAAIRTHKQAITVGYNALNGIEMSNTNGIKGLSCMIAFKNFDLVNGFSIDYMHGVCIGIVPHLLDIWLGKKKLVYEENELYHAKSLNLKQRLEFNRRIVALKPPMRISHKPRPILDRAFFTANEFRSLLFYYIRFSLYGLLSKELITHFNLLSDAIYTLSKSQITKNEILIAGSMLTKFSDQFEYFYGRNAVTINVHMLRHYSQSVLNTGPLWCQSAFPFESNMGKIKRSFNCKVDVVEQIAFNYCLKDASDSTKADNPAKPPQILRLKSKRLTLEQKQMLDATAAKIEVDIHHEIGYEMFWKNQVYKSTTSAITKSIDYFVQLTDGTVGCIEYFIKLGQPCAVVKKYDVLKSYGHLLQVQPSRGKTHELFTCDFIRQKLIYLKFNFSNVSFIEIITSEPNLFECN